MSNGLLQFSLGLTTGGFLGALNRAESGVKGFSRSLLSLPGLGTALGGTIASVSSLHAVVEGVFSAIERGAELEYLSRRTNESVSSLFEMQKGFRAVGLSAEDVGPMIFKLQKSLGGVNEMGEDTRSVFARLGLNLEQLKKMNAPQQFLSVAGALKNLNTASAASAAGAIFGREGSANMVQLANSAGEFADALTKAARDAAVFQRNAESFAKIERGLNQIKGKTQTLFAGMAEGLAPAIEIIEKQLNAIDLSGLGKNIGHIFLAITESFSEGNFAELVGLSLKTGFEVGIAALPVVLETLGLMLIKTFETPLIYLQAGMEYAIESAAHTFATNKWFKAFLEATNPAAALGLQALGDPGKPDWNETLKNRKDSGLEFNLGTGAFGLEAIGGDVKERWEAFKKTAKDLSKPLVAMIDGLVANAPKGEGGKVQEGAKQGNNMMATGGHRTEATDFEKMGFVMGGQRNPMAKTENLLEKIVRNTSVQGSFGSVSGNFYSV